MPISSLRLGPSSTRLAARLAMDLTAPRASIVERATFEPPVTKRADAPGFRPWCSCRKTAIALLIIILSGGIFLRAWPSTGFHKVGVDEGFYSTYVEMAQKDGIWNYGDVVHAYLQSQAKHSDAIVPATRVGFLIPATIIANVAKVDPLTALRYTSLTASILLFFAVGVIAFRTGGIRQGLVMSSLMAVAPLQIHLAQRGLIDGYFAFWAVLCAWFLWENLKAPQRPGWLISYGISLLALVLTKENAAFVFLALAATTVVFTSCKLGRVSWPLVLVSVTVPVLAILLLTMLIGGIGEWFSFYRGFVQKSATLPYAIRLQDGAWYRYLIDFTLLSPCIVALAFGALFQLRKESTLDMFWSLFLGASFILMSSVSCGMSLRFAAYWDVPLRWLAASQLFCLSERFPRIKPSFILVGLVLILAAVDLFQYWRYFVQGAIYDPVSLHLIHISKMIK